MLPGSPQSAPPAVLLIDDDLELCSLLRRLLAGPEFSLETAHDGRDGLRKVFAGHCAAVILDLTLPGISGLDVVRQIRRRSSVPVMMLTARAALEDRLAGLEGGADDYLGKPFHPEELRLRLRALLRRQHAVANPARPPLALNGLVIHPSTRQVTRDAQPVDVTAMEYDILEVLATNAGRVVSRDEIYTVLHQREPSPFERSLDTHLSNLRKKLGGHAGITIHTIRNVGYLLATA
jgi:DNA-binding response OmpR family regulator